MKLVKFLSSCVTTDDVFSVAESTAEEVLSQNEPETEEVHSQEEPADSVSDVEAEPEAVHSQEEPADSVSDVEAEPEAVHSQEEPADSVSEVKEETSSYISVNPYISFQLSEDNDTDTNETVEISSLNTLDRFDDEYEDGKNYLSTCVKNKIQKKKYKIASTEETASVETVEEADTTENTTPEEAIPAETIEETDITENVAPEEAIPAEKATPPSSIKKYFLNNGYEIMETYTPPQIATLKRITFMIGDNYSLIKNLLREMKKAITIKADRTFIYYFLGKNKSTDFVKSFLPMLKTYGILSKCYIYPTKIKATISSIPNVIKFLTGHWLELYCYWTIEDVVKEYCTEHGYKYEVLMNVKLSKVTTPNIYAHEVDNVFSVSTPEKDMFFALECKTGSEFDDYETLYNTRKELKFVPDRYLLISTSLEDEDKINILQYFFEYYVSGISGFREKIETMIKKALEA